MWTRLTTGLAVVLLATGVGAAGCSLAGGSADSSGSAQTGAATFDKNHALDDDVLLDNQAVTEQKIQAFLQKTPYGVASPLAEYRDKNGKAASTILHDA